MYKYNIDEIEKNLNFIKDNNRIINQEFVKLTRFSIILEKLI